MSTKGKIVTVIAKQVSKKLDSEADDSVAGKYHVRLDDDVTESDAAGVALDVFHDNVAVDCLDDFEFTVKDSKGRELVEPDDYQGYSGKDRGTLIN